MINPDQSEKETPNPQLEAVPLTDEMIARLTEMTPGNIAQAQADALRIGGVLAELLNASPKPKGKRGSKKR